MLSLFVLLAASFTCGLAFDRNMVAKFQSPMPHFHEDLFIGRWFSQARLPPCSFHGSAEFTDMQLVLSADSKSVISKVTFRSDMCSQVGARLTLISPGAYTLKDTIGNVVSGDFIVIATDYKCFAITWQCTKRSADGSKCDDTYVAVNTRKLFPRPQTWKKIEQILQDRWQMSLTDMIRMKHETPCPDKPRSKKRFKTY